MGPQLLELQVGTLEPCAIRTRFSRARVQKFRARGKHHVLGLNRGVDDHRRRVSNEASEHHRCWKNSSPQKPRAGFKFILHPVRSISPVKSLEGCTGYFRGSMNEKIARSISKLAIEEGDNVLA